MTEPFPRRVPGDIFAWTALLVAIGTVAGSLYLSGPMGLKACPLCFYQRTFAMAAVGILFVGLLSRVEGELLCLLTLPSAIGGLGVALFHVYLLQTERLECPKGIFDLGPAPLQSLAAYGLLMVPLLAGVLRTRALLFLAAVALGGAFVWASLGFNPPPQPAKPDTCGVPYREPS